MTCTPDFLASRTRGRLYLRSDLGVGCFRTRIPSACADRARTAQYLGSRRMGAVDPWCSERPHCARIQARPVLPGHLRPPGAQAAQDGCLSQSPLLDKDPLRADPERFVDPTFRPRRTRTFLTSGSSGTPIATIWSTPELRASNMAIREARSARWAGTSFRYPRATFGPNG